MEAKDEQPGKPDEVRRIQNQSEYDVDANECDEFGQLSQAAGYQSQRSSGANGEEFRKQGRKASFGGMLRQLRKIRDAHLAYVNAHTERLKARLAEDEEHRQQIIEDLNRLEQQIIEQLGEGEVQSETE